MKFHIVVYKSVSDTIRQMFFNCGRPIWFSDRCLFLIANQTIDQAYVGWNRFHRLYLQYYSDLLANFQV
jgi:hypothetical protein